MDRARLAETLYAEALLLGDDMRAYFDHAGHADRDQLSQIARLHFACESLKATTRLMHVLAWLAHRQARDGAALADADPAGQWLATATASEPDVLGLLPSPARKLILAGIDLYGQVGRLAEGTEAPVATLSPARALFRRLEDAF